MNVVEPAVPVRVFVHAATHEAVVTKLHQHISAIVSGASYQKWSRETGYKPLSSMTLHETAALYAAEQSRSKRLAAAMKLVPQWESTHAACNDRAVFRH